MGDWTTGRGFGRADNSGPSRAEQARYEAAAETRADKTRVRKAAGKREFRPRKDRGWLEGYTPYTSGIEGRKRAARALEAEIQTWERLERGAMAEHGTRKERRIRRAQIRRCLTRARRTLDRIK